MTYLPSSRLRKGLLPTAIFLIAASLCWASGAKEQTTEAASGPDMERALKTGGRSADLCEPRSSLGDGSIAGEPGLFQLLHRHARGQLQRMGQ